MLYEMLSEAKICIYQTYSLPLDFHHNCKGETKEVALSQAKEMGLTPCGYCYKTNRKHKANYYNDWDD